MEILRSPYWGETQNYSKATNKITHLKDILRANENPVQVIMGDRLTGR